MKKIKLQRIKIQKSYRTTIALILGVIILIPILYAILFIPFEPGVTTENIVACTNYQKGVYDYTAYLKDNEVYDNKTILKQGEGAIFKAITDYINISFSYNFFIECGELIEATYSLDYKLQTNSWSKEYNIINESKLGSYRYNTDFKLNLTEYEDIVNNIEDEINIVSQNPTLNITSTINILYKTDNGTISESFYPNISIPLKQNIINIEGNLTHFSIKTIEDTIEIPEPIEELNNERNYYISIAVILFVPFILFIILTKNATYKPDKSQRQIQKILKKYKEWIIEVEKQPKKSNFIEKIITKSIDDLIKISEELGKPIMYYYSKENNISIFYVIDNKILYEYSIKNEGKENKKDESEKDQIEKEISEEIEMTIVELLKENVPYEGIRSQVQYKNKKGKIEYPSRSLVNKIRKKHIVEIKNI